MSLTVELERKEGELPLEAPKPRLLFVADAEMEASHEEAIQEALLRSDPRQGWRFKPKSAWKLSDAMYAAYETLVKTGRRSQNFENWHSDRKNASCAMGLALEARYGEDSNVDYDFESVIRTFGLPDSLAQKVAGLNDINKVSIDRIADIVRQQGF